MTANQVMEKMIKGHSWTSICKEMERKGIDRKTINLTIDEAKRMKKALEVSVPTL